MPPHPAAGVQAGLIHRDRTIRGHSQGGQAALFAGQQARGHAPELRVRAVAVAAPAADLGRLLTDDIGDDPGVTISAYAFATYQTAYAAGYPGLSLESILTPQGAALTPRMAQCACSASTKSCMQRPRHWSATT